MTRRSTLALGFGGSLVAVASAGVMLLPDAPPLLAQTEVQPQARQEANVPATGTPADSDVVRPPAVSDDPEARRLEFDRALVDAAVLRNEYEQSRRSRSKKQWSLSAFRSLELRLGAIADADPSNTQARDMANTMKMIQFEILQPSMEIAAIADRQLYADTMAERMKGEGLRVEALGPRSEAVRFSSPHMTRQLGIRLSESAKIPEQARRLQFRSVVFSNGRRRWTFDVASGRLR